MNDRPTEEKAVHHNRALIVALIGAILAAGLFCALWLTSRSTDPESIDRTLSEHLPAASATAEEVIELLVNFDADNAGETGERMGELSTSDFQEDNEDLYPLLGPAFERTGTRATGEIIEGPDVTFSSADEAVAVARVDQTISTRGAERSEVFTVRLALRSEDGDWKVDGFEVLGEL